MQKKFPPKKEKENFSKKNIIGNQKKIDKMVDDVQIRWINYLKKKLEKQKNRKNNCNNKQYIPAPPKKFISYSPDEEIENNLEEILNYEVVKKSLEKREITTSQLKELKAWLSLGNNKVYIWIDIAKTMQYLAILVVDKYWLEIWTYYFWYFYNDQKWFKYLENVIDFIISKNNSDIILWVEATWIYHSPLINYLEKKNEEKISWHKDKKLTLATINAVEISSRRKWSQWSKNDKLDAWIIAHYLKESYWEFFLLKEKRKILEEESKNNSKTWTSVKVLKEVWQQISELLKIDNKKSITQKKAELLKNYPDFFAEPKRMDALKYSHERKHISSKKPEFYTDEEKLQISIFDKQNKKEEVIEQKLKKIEDSNKIASITNNKYYTLRTIYRDLAKVKKHLALTNREIHRKNTYFFWFPTWSLLSREFTQIEIFVLSNFNAFELQDITFEQFRDICIENMWFLMKWNRYKATLRTAYDKLKNNVWVSMGNHLLPTKNLLREDYIQRDFLKTRIESLEDWIRQELKRLNAFIPKMSWITDINFWLFHAELWDMIKTNKIKDIVSYIWHIPKRQAESWDSSDRARWNWNWKTMWIKKWGKTYLTSEVYNMNFQVCNKVKSEFFYSMFRELKTGKWDWTWNHYFGKMWAKLIRTIIWLIKNEEDYNKEKAIRNREKWILLAKFLKEQNKEREANPKELVQDYSDSFNKNKNKNKNPNKGNKYKKFEPYYLKHKTKEFKKFFWEKVNSVLQKKQE